MREAGPCPLRELTMTDLRPHAVIDADSFDFASFAPRERAVLLFVLRARGDGVRELLLILKKRGLGAGKINAPGGRIEPGETPAEAAMRECQEEVCVSARSPRLAGQLLFQFVDGFSLTCTVFWTDEFTGSPAETDEAVPLWTAEDELPYDAMWQDDRHWLPHLLAGRHFVGRFVFDGDRMARMELDVEPA